MKHLRLNVLLVLCLILVPTLSLLIPHARAAAETKLAVPYMYQGSTQWCFLNSLSMVLQYYGVRIHPQDLAHVWNLGHDEGTGSILQELISNNVKNLVESKGLTADVPSVIGSWNLDYYKNHIDAGEPVILAGYSVSLQIIPNGGHAVVVTGYISNSTGDYLLIHDPSGYFVASEWKDWAQSSYPYMYAVAPWPKVIAYFENLYNLLNMYNIVIHGTPQPPLGTMFLQDYDISHVRPVAVQSNAGSLYLGDSIAWTGNGGVAGGQEILPDERLDVSPAITNQYDVSRTYTVKVTLSNDASSLELVSQTKIQTVGAHELSTLRISLDLSKLSTITPGAYDLTTTLWGPNPDFQSDTPYDSIGPLIMPVASGGYGNEDAFPAFQGVTVAPVGSLHLIDWTVDIKASISGYLHITNSGWYWSFYADAYMTKDTTQYLDTGITGLEFKVDAFSPSGGQIYTGSWTTTDTDGDGVYGDFSHLGGSTPSVQSPLYTSSVPRYVTLKLQWRISNEDLYPVPDVWQYSSVADALRLWQPRSGGPDQFGYTFADSGAPKGPNYNWMEISGTGSIILTNSDDSWLSNVNLGFFFNYYGTDYSQLAISNNGLLFSGAGSSQYVNQPITQTPSLHGFIAPYWDDLVTWDSPSSAVYYQTIGTAPNREFVVEWYNNHHYQHSDSGITLEAILFEGTDNILFQYNSVSFGNVFRATSSDLGPYDNGGSATVGIEDPTGNIGLQYSYNEQIIFPGLAILFKFPAFSGTNMFLSVNAPSTMDHGNTMSYSLYYNNFGDTPAPNVMLQASLSPNVNFVSTSDSGSYDFSTRIVTWNIGSVLPFPSGRGLETVTVTIPSTVPVGTTIQTTSTISTPTLETRYDDNTASAQTIVTGSSLPPNVGVGPTGGNTGGTPSVYWMTPITFTYYDASATGVAIRIHFSDGGPDIVGTMTGGPPAWSFTTTFYPRHGQATVTYTITSPTPSSVSFNIYVDPSGYVYDSRSGARVSGATVWLQRPDGQGGWEDVSTGQVPPIMLPDTNPLTTSADGQFHWDVLNGTYRVRVEAIGYLSANSTVVTVPPPVTNLQIGLTPLITDNIPPITVASSSPAANSFGWNNNNVTVTFSAMDGQGGSGVRQIYYTATGAQTGTATVEGANASVTIFAEGITTLVYYATDNAGNTETTHSLSILIDKTSPNVTGHPDRQPNGLGWYNQTVAISWLGTDSLSGIASCNPPNTYSGPDGASITLNGGCNDRAGNTRSGHISISFDSTPPTISSTQQGATFLLNATVLPLFTYSDITSGIASCSVVSTGTGTLDCTAFLARMLNTTRVGLHHYAISAVDSAGNSVMASITYNVVYRFGGFLPPDNRTFFSLNSTIPMQFQLFDAHNNTVNNAVAKIYVDGVAASSNGKSNSGNLLRYDPTSQQYLFNLKTKGLQPGSHMITVSLDDGTVQTLNISLHIPGDVNGDGRVDLTDLVTVGVSMGSTPGGLYCNPAADLNGDGIIDTIDLVIVATHLGSHS